MAIHSDLVVIGGGPAGLSAAINGASEGLIIDLLDAGSSLGGQAKESSAIENYAGFPEGLTGDDLVGRFTQQARKFGTRFHIPVSAARIDIDEEGYKRILTDDYEEYVTKAVILGTGLSYRRLDAINMGPLMGRGVFYGLPQGRMPAGRECKIAVIGGANSAGQAVIRLARNPNANIKMIIRNKIEDQMSAYLIERIREMKNVDVIEGASIIEACGRRRLDSAIMKDRAGTCERIPLDYLLVFIGATPKTLWLKDSIELDDNRYIRTWNDLEHCERRVLPYETSMPGVFAAGDVRLGSTKRIASGVGEGASALSMVHGYLSKFG